MTASDAGKKRKGSGFQRFATMEWIESLPVSSSEANVMLYLGHRLDAEYTCFPSRSRISQGTKLSKRTISRVLKSLSERGVVEIDKTRNRNGHIVFDKIRLLVPMHIQSPIPRASDKVTPRPRDNQGHMKGGARDSVSLRSIQVEGKYSIEREKEPEMGVAESLGSTLPARSKKEFIGKKVQKILIAPEDENSLLAGIGALLHPATADYEYQAWADEFKPLVDGCVLVSHYGRSCANGSPNARVAFWHALGRVHFPSRPRFSRGHKLPNGQSRRLHQFFDEMKQQACPMLASLFSDWHAIGEKVARQAGEDPPPVPEIDYIMCELEAFLRYWRGRLGAVQFSTEAERQQVFVWLGLDA